MFHLFCKTDAWSQSAATLATGMFGTQVRVVSGNEGEYCPSFTDVMAGDVLLSFLCPWVIPGAVLARTELALNFHPGTRHYPGIGCYNFALYEEATEYGAVCHRMAEKVDTGPIILERTFPVSQDDTVELLKFRTRVVLLSLFHDVLGSLRSGIPLGDGTIEWTRRPFRLIDLVALRTLRPDMTAREMALRIHATSYPGCPPPRILINDMAFEFPVPQRSPIA